MHLYDATPTAIEHAAADLRRGAVIAFPTETVYGLGADASNAHAVRRVFMIKGRPADHPLILHIAAADQLSRWAAEVPPVAFALAERFWPGPLTLILPRAAHVPDEVTGGQDTVAVRVPAHPVALALLHAFGGALAAPSANPYGKTSPTCAGHVAAQLGARIDGLIDGGACDVGIESTILDLTGPTARILRQGMITAPMLADVLGYLPPLAQAVAVRVPGTHHSHYAPNAAVALVDAPFLPEAVQQWLRARGNAHVLCWSDAATTFPGATVSRLPATAAGYAAQLYASLHRADREGAAAILVERPPSAPEWDAVHDRLRRASANTRCSPEGWPLLERSAAPL